MNNIYLNVINSNLKKIDKCRNYDISLIKYISSGSYGIIFMTNIENYVAKIFFEDKTKKSDISDYTDFHETETVEKIINNKSMFNFCCSDYAYGKLLIEDYSSDENSQSDQEINIYINENFSLSPFESEIGGEINKKFYLFEGNFVILLPIYIDFRDHIEFIGKNMFLNEMFLMRLIYILILAVEEQRKIGIINIDLKMSNLMVDKNNKLKLIDFGFAKSVEKKDENFQIQDKYFIWPNRSRGYKYDDITAYMISIIIFELVFERKINNLTKNQNLLNFFILDFSNISYFSQTFKEFITNPLKIPVSFEKFKKEYFEITNIDFDDLTLPSYYHIILESKGLAIFN